MSFAAAGAEKTNAQKLNSLSDRYTQIKKDLLALEKTRDMFFEHLKNSEKALRNLFTLKFDAKNVTLDNLTKELVIKLPRKAAEYSTGEIDFMVALVRINEFIGSDSAVLILDDPITSFDIANQYLVLFDLIKVATNSQLRKSVIIFTHNIACINIAESQRTGAFKYSCLDRDNIGLRFIPITINKRNAVRHCFLCQETIQAEAENSNQEETKIRNAYISAAIQRDTKGCEKLHSIFHYDGTVIKETYGSFTLSNTFLISLIDNPNLLFQKNDFISLRIDKEIALIALRIWVEKELVDGTANQSILKDKNLFQKVTTIFPTSNISSWNGNPKITREYLMSKKVMLNQASHEKAQEIPFEFALNLSIYSLKNEIADIKAHFISE